MCVVAASTEKPSICNRGQLVIGGSLFWGTFCIGFTLFLWGFFPKWLFDWGANCPMALVRELFAWGVRHRTTKWSLELSTMAQGIVREWVYKKKTKQVRTKATEPTVFCHCWHPQQNVPSPQIICPSNRWPPQELLVSEELLGLWRPRLRRSYFH